MPYHINSPDFNVPTSNHLKSTLLLKIIWFKQTFHLHITRFICNKSKHLIQTPFHQIIWFVLDFSLSYNLIVKKLSHLVHTPNLQIARFKRHITKSHYLITYLKLIPPDHMTHTQHFYFTWFKCNTTKPPNCITWTIYATTQNLLIQLSDHLIIWCICNTFILPDSPAPPSDHLTHTLHHQIN